MLGAKLAPHPLATYNSALRLEHPAGTGIPTDYIVCNKPLYTPLAASRERARSKGWPIHTIASAHDAMITKPAAVADLLDSFG